MKSLVTFHRRCVLRDLDIQISRLPNSKNLLVWCPWPCPVFNHIKDIFEPQLLVHSVEWSASRKSFVRHSQREEEVEVTRTRVLCGKCSFRLSKRNMVVHALQNFHHSIRRLLECQFVCGYVEVTDGEEMTHRYDGRCFTRLAPDRSMKWSR